MKEHWCSICCWEGGELKSWESSEMERREKVKESWGSKLGWLERWEDS